MRWIELAAITDGTLVPEVVARGLGVGLAPGGSPAAALASAIAGMNALIVLDNCEHLVESVSALVDTVLRRVPKARFVMTSQEPLRVPRENVFRLQPLTTPPADASLTPALASGFTAIALFTERATAVDRRFHLSPANVGVVVDICRRLDGIPLAIELAAARVPMMGVEALQQRLDERFRVLTAGARTVLRRHQTLRATLEWSHGLLSAEEQAVFRRLGVFSGGASLAMVQAVASDATLDEWRVLSALGTLVDKSLVVADGGDAPRYRLLETARAYALEQLAATGETAAWIRRHACAILDMLTTRTANTWLRDRIPDLAVELDNVRAALEWALGDHGDPALAVALVAHAFPVWRVSVSQAEGLRLAKAAALRLDDSTPTPIRARFWLTYAALGMFSAWADCFEAAAHAAALLRSLGDTRGLYEALGLRAAIAARRQDFAVAPPRSRKRSESRTRRGRRAAAFCSLLPPGSRRCGRDATPTRVSTRSGRPIWPARAAAGRSRCSWGWATSPPATSGAASRRVEPRYCAGHCGVGSHWRGERGRACFRQLGGGAVAAGRTRPGADRSAPRVRPAAARRRPVGALVDARKVGGGER